MKRRLIHALKLVEPWGLTRWRMNRLYRGEDEIMASCPHPSQAITPLCWMCNDCGAVLDEPVPLGFSSSNHTIRYECAT